MPHARCSRCRSRRTLARAPDQYVRPPRCHRCGSNKWRLDRYRQTVERAKGLTCNPGRGGCSQYHFPHRRGSGYCIHNHRLTDERLRLREEPPPAWGPEIELADAPF